MNEEIKKVDKFITKKGKVAKEMIKEIALDAEPLIDKAREKIQKASKNTEEKVKEFYATKIKRKK